MLYSDASQLIGNTPLMELTNIEKKLGLKARLCAKLEFLNPTGSAKDRIALAMIEAAEKRGILKPGGTVIEPTSGNTGIGLASVAAVRGYKAIIVMPDTMSAERIALIRAYGAEVVLTPGAEGMKGSIEKAKQLNSEIENSFIPDQFNNEANSAYHKKTTGPEIYKDTKGRVDYFVAGVGTGGTLTGCGEYLKEQKPDTRIVAVEPAASPLLSQGFAGPHGLQGIGANFIPGVLNRDIIDEIIAVENEEAYEYGRLLAVTEGILCGITSGAALFAAVMLAKRPEAEGKTIVVLLPDSGDRYLSTPMFS